MRIAALFSGGKDSTFAIYLAKQAGNNIECLITMHPLTDESALFHYPNSHVTRYLAETMDIPLIEAVIKAGSGRQDETEALAAAVAEAKSLYNIEGLLSGGIASVFQKQSFDHVCKKNSIAAVEPLWGVDPEQYLAELLSHNFVVMIVGVSAMGLEQEWLGSIIDKKSIAKLAQLSKKYGFNLAFEGGEAETLVLDCPLYSKRLAVKQATVKWDGQRGMFEILEAELLDK